MEETKATYLIVRYLSGEATPGEREQLLNWISQDAANRKVFEEHHSLWEEQLTSQLSFNLSQGLHRLNYRIDQHEAREGRRSLSVGWQKIAAAVSIILISCVAVYFLGFHSEQRGSLTWVEHNTQRGERRTVILSDGSVIYVNANSTLNAPKVFAGSTREVFLTGEAFFEVAKDSLRPFVIHTGNLTTQVLGTSFNINTRTNQVVVSVATGKVNVTNGQDVQVLIPHEKVTYSENSRQLTKSTADLETDLAWRYNTIIFDDTSLDNAAKKLEEHFNVSIVFENEALRKCLITGKFKNVPLDKILKAVGYSTGLKFTINHSEVHVSGNGCE